MTIDVQSLFDLDGRVAIVTGASSGLGERFARVLHAAGASVMAAARRIDRLEALAASVGDDTRFAVMPCDVTSDADCERLTSAAAGRFGRVDVLVNNAGKAYTLPAEVETPDQFREVIDVNLNGLFVLSQSVGRTMIEQGSGSIVNVASMLGLVASTPVKQASYCASKGAVVNLTRELAAQWARKGVRVNALAPGWFPREMTASRRSRSCNARAPWDGSETRPSSTGRSCSSHPTRPATAPARPSPSTAAGPPVDSGVT